MATSDPIAEELNKNTDIKIIKIPNMEDNPNI
jgi:hypothetical protein